MRSSWQAGLFTSVILLAGCTATPAPADVQIAAVDTVDDRIILNDAKALAEEQGERIVITGIRSALRTGKLDDYLQALSDASCPKGSTARAAEAIPISAMRVAMTASDPSLRKAGHLSFVAAYELSSSDARFGGLSGLDILDNGNLLAISDAGHFIWIDLAKDELTPTAARIATMRDVSGQPLAGIAGDSAEGLAVNGGMTLVSFEGNHRVLAFDTGKCGAAARGAPIVFGDYGMSLNEAYEEARIAVASGSGSEPLAVSKDWYVFAGIERKVGVVNSLSARPIEAEPEFDLRVGVNAPEFAGMDLLPGASADNAKAFLIHRAPASRNGAVWITETDLLRFQPDTEGRRPSRGEMETRARQRYAELSWRELARLDQHGVTDAFEGIAAKPLSDGRVRLYLISDDDYAADKRTVLMVFDVPKPSR